MKNSRWFLPILMSGIAAISWQAPGTRAMPTDSAEAPESHPADASEEHADEHEPLIRIEHDESGRPVLTIREDVSARIGVTTASVIDAELQPSVTAFGLIETDPSASFTVRSPIAGYLQVADGASWPRPGDNVLAGTTFGVIQPRLSPVETYDLRTRLATARAEAEEVAADLAAARSSYESKKELNENQKVVTQRVIEEARAKVKSGEARLAAAEATVHLLEDALSGQDASKTIAVKLDRPGLIVDALVQPGETVEPGEVLLRTTDLSHLLARVALPWGVVPPTVPTDARIEPIGAEATVLKGKVLAPPTVNASSTPGLGFLVAITTDGGVVRPGLAVIAHLEVPGTPLKGVVVPRAAVVRFGGTAFVYTRTGENEFTREAIVIDQPLESGWFATSGISKGDVVVVTGAGSLLSEELRGQIEAEAEGGD